VDTTDESLTAEDGDEPGAAIAPSGSGRRWAIAAVVASMLLLVIGVIGRYVQLPYDTLAPGSARSVHAAIEVKGHPVYPPQGKIFYTTVSVRERINPYEALAGWIDPAVEVIPETKVRGTVPPDQFKRMNVEAMADSKTTAQVLALRELGYTNLGRGAEVVEVQEGLPAATVLKPNDVLIEVDGKTIATSTDAVTAIRSRAAGDTVVMRVIRGDAQPVEVRAVLAESEGRPLLGVRLSTKIKLPFEITIDSGRVVGPSAGLAYGLELLDVLTPGELTGGQSVAATGELLADGTVGPIGGVAQKAVSVRRAGIKVFLVPKENEAEARAHAGNGLEIHGVGSFDEALKALAGLDGSNALALGKPGAGA
jgi:PDZ domain-containing protein